MRRIWVVGLLTVLLVSGWIAVELLTKPRDIDVSDCHTRWREGRIVSVTCPGGVPG